MQLTKPTQKLSQQEKNIKKVFRVLNLRAKGGMGSIHYIALKVFVMISAVEKFNTVDVESTPQHKIAAQRVCYLIYHMRMLLFARRGMKWQCKFCKTM